MKTQTTVDNMTNNTTITEETTMNNYKYNNIYVRTMEQYIKAVESGHTCNSIRTICELYDQVYRYLLLHKDDSDRNMMLYAHCLVSNRADNSVTRLSIDELHNKGINIMRQLADSGYGEAMFMLGMYHLMGSNVDKDKAKAIDYIMQACQAGFGNAMVRMATFYMNGDGVEQDTDKANKLLEQAVEAGVDSVPYILACATSNIDERIALLQKAADNGDNEARVDLAAIYLKGDVVPKDTDKAIELYQACVDDGDIIKNGRIADIYRASDKAEDNLKAVQIYISMAEQGNTTALCKLGELYLNGDIVPQDIAKAYNYFDLAGESNSVVAVRYLCRLYAGKCGDDMKTKFDKVWIDEQMELMHSYTSSK